MVAARLISHVNMGVNSVNQSGFKFVGWAHFYSVEIFKLLVQSVSTTPYYFIGKVTKVVVKLLPI